MARHSTEADFEARYQARLDKYRAWQEVEERLRGLAPKALDALEDILDNAEDPKLTAQVALALLRAAGLYGLNPPCPPNRALMHLEDMI